MTTPADPGTIDLDDARGHVSGLLGEAGGDRLSSLYFAAERISTMIAVIEELRKRVEELEAPVGDAPRAGAATSRGDHIVEWFAKLDIAARTEED